MIISHLEINSEHSKYDLLSKRFNEYLFAPCTSTNLVDKKGINFLMIYICYAKVVKPIVIRILIDYGIKINHLDNDGWNVLTYASCYETPLSVWEILIDSGADINIIDNYGKNVMERFVFRFRHYKIGAEQEKII